MKFLHTADLHLNITLKSASFRDAKAHENRIYELQQSFYRIIDAANEEEVDALLLAGDLFDDPYMPLQEMEKLFDKLAALKCEVFLLIGNHDVFLQNPSYQSLLKGKNIHIFTKEDYKVELDDTLVFGINTRDFSEAFLQKLAREANTEKNTILLLHGDVQNKQDDHYLCDVKTLESLPFDYIALGHIHKHAFLRSHIAYSGNPEPLDFSETDKKGYIEGTLENKRLDATFVPMQKRRFRVKKVALSGSDTFVDIVERIKGEVDEDQKRNDFVRVELTGEIDSAENLDLNKLKDLLSEEFYYIELKDETTPAIDLSALKETYSDSIVAHLIEQYEKSPSEKGYDSLMLAIRALLRTEERES